MTMTTSALIRYNVDRLVRDHAARRPTLDRHELLSALALEAWPLPEGLDPGKGHRLATAVRRRKLQRIMTSAERLSGRNIDDLARALGVEPAEFLRQPIN